MTLDVQKVSVPAYVLPARPEANGQQEIVCRTEKFWNFTIKFPRPLIRRGH